MIKSLLITFLLGISLNLAADEELELPFESNLAPFKNLRALAVEFISALHNIEHMAILRITVKEGKLFFDDLRSFDKGTSNPYKKNLKELHKLKKLPDVDFEFFLLSDNCPLQASLTVS